MNKSDKTPISQEAIAIQVVDSRSLLSAMLDHYCKTVSAISGNTPETIREEVFALANQYKPMVVQMMMSDSDSNPANNGQQ